MAFSLSILLGRRFVVLVLAALVPIADSAADPQPGDAAAGAYASEVPNEALVDDRGEPPVPVGDEGSIPVAEEIDFILGNTFRKDGAYDESVKRVAGVEYYGTRYVGCEQHAVEIRADRPDRIATRVKTGNLSRFESRRSGQDIVIHGKPPGLGVNEERALLETFALDTPIIELEKKLSPIKPLGMEKLPGILAWKLGVERAGGYRQVLYVDSHYGDVVKTRIIDPSGRPVLEVVQHDYRAVDGIRVPFAIDYRSPDGTLLASDRYERVAVKRGHS